MDTKHQLRLNGFATTGDGKLLCNRDTGPLGRYRHELCGAIRLDLSDATPAGRALVEKLVGIVDEPRCLVGRHKNGSAIVLGQASGIIIPHLPQDNRATSLEGIFNLLVGDSGLTVIANNSAAIDVDAWSWRERSPLNTPREALGLLNDHHGEDVMLAALAGGATWAPTAREIAEEAARKEKFAKIQAKIDSGEIKLNLTADEQQAIDDEAIVAANAGRDISIDDGVMGRLVLDARARHARRQRVAA